MHAGKPSDLDEHRISISLLKKCRSQWGLKSSRGQAHTIDSIGPAIERVRKRFPKQGSHDMKQTLLQEEHIMVSRDLILQYMNLHHPDEVQVRKSRQLKRSTYWTAGLHDIWVFDQHDKWRRFQLFLHVGIEPFSGHILWLKIWWTNRNPRLICGWYCDTVQTLGAMPLVTQSDPSTENNGIANGHTMLRHLQDPALARTLQHKFKGQHRNIKPEIFWSQLRRRWAPGFEDVLDFGLNNGIYNPDDALERLVFHFIFIPWLQDELDRFAAKFNNTKPRFNMHKILPHGRPSDIFHHPERFTSRDFSVKADIHSLELVRQTYAPPDHSVFLLVPQEFFKQAAAFMKELNHAEITHDNIWDVYAELLMCFRSIEDEDHVQNIIATQPGVSGDGEELIGSEKMDVVDLPPYIEGAGCGVIVDASAGNNSSDEDSDFYDFVWTDEEDC
ncbi:hypothetical protein CY34DRAFT_760918 [Suillus luteus UH-Slu-Lm8-n1]|uniref:Unplaced genomic scaffold CY34scaffold_1294, whole genome shotgun sequence n=1 Tax=Suillus luteus UH-Slu-Lm8-n1 TaxID=930992 RepID=A0A0C9Z3X0_9AGAM|nr:hypothetical protein CY34DRAFT_760918 [Suillus luteus UH-Slu-Lm8-n1]